MKALEMTGERTERMEEGEKAGCSRERNDSRRNRETHNAPLPKGEGMNGGREMRK